MITSVYWTYGHRFISEGDESTDSCMVCGAVYNLVPDEDDPTTGRYVAANGDEPQPCTYDTSMEHGYEHEQEHDCNCVMCK